jgi:ST7 protein
VKSYAFNFIYLIIFFIQYAFFNLRHWKNVNGALNLLQNTWEGTFRIIPYPLQKGKTFDIKCISTHKCMHILKSHFLGHLFYPYPALCTECADRELLPSFHEVSIYPKKEVPFFILFTAGLCSCTALLALLTHSYPDVMFVFAQTILNFIYTPFKFVKEMLSH